MPKKPVRNLHNIPYYKNGYGRFINHVAEYAILRFFRNKSFYCGGPIPRKILLSKRSLNIVLGTPINEHSMNYIYNCCIPQIRRDKKYQDKSVPWDVHCVLTLLNEMMDLGLPREFYAGLMILYFEFCHGIKKYA